MTPHYSDPLVTLYLGDCLDVMRELPDASVDSVVTDPPYDLTSGKKGGTGAASVNLNSPYGRARIGTGNGTGGFMGKAWDGTGIAFDPETWRLAFRVLKPGGYLLAFGGTRTYHRLASAIEDAGFEIRDTLMWIYASGFPKSLDVSKALDKVAGAEREVTVGGSDGVKRKPRAMAPGGAPREAVQTTSAPATDLARQWQGWGTALKPAHEPIVMARKPLVGTVAANVTRYGTGALNIDGTRIPGEPWQAHDASGLASVKFFTDGEAPVIHKEPHNGGRWPSNILLSDPDLFDEPNPGVVGSGATSVSVDNVRHNGSFKSFSKGAETERDSFGHSDSGGYSRFFLIPKADRAERERGLADHPKQIVDIAGQNTPEGRAGRGVTSEYQPRANVHPTVKPIDLMRHLVKLVTPPGGTCLDPFLGSGTTALAASELGVKCIGIEREADYLSIAKGRLMATPMGLGLFSDVVTPDKPADEGAA